MPSRGNLTTERDNIDSNFSGSNDKHSHRYIPSVNNSFYSSPTYADTKEKCKMCPQFYINKSRITRKNNAGLCESCYSRYGRYHTFK